MLLTGKLMTAFCVFLLSGAIPVHAQLGGEQADATRILNGMPLTFWQRYGPWHRSFNRASKTEKSRMPRFDKAWRPGNLERS